MSMVMASTHKPKVQAPQPERRHGQTDGAARNQPGGRSGGNDKVRRCVPAETEVEAPAAEARPKRRLRPKQTPADGEAPAEAEAAAEPKRSSRRAKEASNTDPIKGRVSGAEAGRMGNMPKMKSHKGAQKRFGVTGGGKVVRVKRGVATTWTSSPRDAPGRYWQGRAERTSKEQVKRLLPYL